jgi:hypothetical protein
VLEGWLQSIEESALAQAVREGPILYPSVQTVHLLGLAVLGGSIVAFDLRLLGFTRSISVRRLAAHVLPPAWIGFGAAAISGALLFAANATEMAAHPTFKIKLLSIALAGCTLAAYHLGPARRIQTWDGDTRPPAVARIIGATSLVLWTAVIACGRLIAYT